MITHRDAMQFAKYAAGGMVTLVFYVAATEILHRFSPLNLRLCATISFIASMALNFAIHRYWTYDKTRTLGVSFTHYCLLTGAGFVLQMAFIQWLPVFLNVHESFAIYAFAVIWPVVSFFLMRAFVF